MWCAYGMTGTCADVTNQILQCALSHLQSCRQLIALTHAPYRDLEARRLVVQDYVPDPCVYAREEYYSFSIND
jgi:hypothetical protein